MTDITSDTNSMIAYSAIAGFTRLKRITLATILICTEEEVILAASSPIEQVVFLFSGTTPEQSGAWIYEFVQTRLDLARYGGGPGLANIYLAVMSSPTAQLPYFVGYESQPLTLPITDQPVTVYQPHTTVVYPKVSRQRPVGAIYTNNSAFFMEILANSAIPVIEITRYILLYLSDQLHNFIDLLNEGYSLKIETADTDAMYDDLLDCILYDAIDDMNDRGPVRHMLEEEHTVEEINWLARVDNSLNQLIASSGHPIRPRYPDTAEMVAAQTRPFVEPSGYIFLMTSEEYRGDLVADMANFCSD